MVHGATESGTRMAVEMILINDRQYVGRGSALVYSADESLLCVDKRLELVH